MASDKKITVEVIGRDVEYASNGGGTSKQTKQNNGRINLSALISPLKTDEKEILADNIITQKAVNDIKGLISNGVTYSLTRRLTLSEDYMAQNDMNIAITGINKVSSLFTAIFAGMKIGGSVGAGVGMVAYVALEGLNAYQRYDQAYIQVNEQNYETSFQRTRLGLNDNGRGTQN